MKICFKVLIISFLSISFLSACKQRNATSDEPIHSVEVIRPTFMDHQTIKTYSARVKESDQIDVAFKTGGQIEKVYGATSKARTAVSQSGIQ